MAAPPKLSFEVKKNLGGLRWKVLKEKYIVVACAGRVLIFRVPAQVVGSGAEGEREVRWGRAKEGCGPMMGDLGYRVD